MKTMKRLGIVILAILMVMASAFAVDNSAGVYTIQQCILLERAMFNGAGDGYWSLYVSDSLASTYRMPIYDAVDSWNDTEASTGFSYRYADESSPYYSSCGIKIVVGNYGLTEDDEMFGARGATTYYKSDWTEVSSEGSLGQGDNWDFGLVRLNNTKIEEDETKTETLFDNYVKSEAITSTTAHEIGHVLGLADNDNYFYEEGQMVLMNEQLEWRYLRARIIGPMAGDIDGVIDINERTDPPFENNSTDGGTSMDLPMTDAMLRDEPTMQLDAYLASIDDIQTATFCGYGEIVGMGNGLIDLGGHVIDDTAYYVENIFRTDAGETLVLLEYIGFGEDRNVRNAMPKAGEYVLFISEAQDQLYLPNPGLAVQQVVDGEIAWSDEAKATFVNLPETMTVVELQEYVQ